MENRRIKLALRIAMALIFILSLVWQGNHNTQTAYAWNNVRVHSAVNENAYDRFVREWMPIDPYLKQASLDGRQAYGESWEPQDGTSWVDRLPPVTRKHTIREWLSAGGFSADEPELSMSLMHFYDPANETHYLTDGINDIELPVGGGTIKAGAIYNPNIDIFQWGFESADNPFSFTNGESYLKQAMASTEADNINYGKAWRAVGETMHVISDMNVPAHVRNDAHIPYANMWDPLEYFTDPNDIEIFKDGKPTSDFGDYHTAYPNQKNIRSLFKEVADWTNRNFFSRDTVPQYNSDTTPNGKNAYPNPVVKIDPNVSGYYTTDFNGDTKFPLARASITGMLWKTPTLVVDQTVCYAQRSVLIPTSIKASAAVLDAFLPRFQVKVDNVRPDAGSSGSYTVTAHILQIPTIEWSTDLIIKNGAHIKVDSTDNEITTSTNLDNHNNLNSIEFKVSAKPGSTVTVYYDLGGYKITSNAFKIPNITVSIDPPSMKNGEINHNYSFTARADNAPAKVQYAWSLDGQSTQTGISNSFLTKFSKAGNYTLGVKLLDESGKELCTASAPVAIIAASPSPSPSPTPTPTPTVDRLKKIQSTKNIFASFATQMNFDNTISGCEITTPNIMPITWQGTNFSGTVTAANGGKDFSIQGSVSPDGTTLINLRLVMTYATQSNTLEISNLPLTANNDFWGVGTDIKKYVTKFDGHTPRLWSISGVIWDKNAAIHIVFE